MPGDSEPPSGGVGRGGAEFAATASPRAGGPDRRVRQGEQGQIYHYFGSKDELFDRCSTRWCGDHQEAPLDPLTCPLRGATVRRFEENPYLGRLAAWYRLERRRPKRRWSRSPANRGKVERIEAAQRAGSCPTGSPRPTCSAVVTSPDVDRAHAEHNELLGTRTRSTRQVVVDAVTTLIGISERLSGAVATAAHERG